MGAQIKETDARIEGMNGQNREKMLRMKIRMLEMRRWRVRLRKRVFRTGK